MRVSLAEEEPITRPKGLLKGQSSVPLGRTAGGFRLGSEQLGVGHLAPATRPREVEANVPGSCSSRHHLCPEKCHREVRPQPVRRGFGIIRCLLAELLRGGPDGHRAEPLLRFLLPSVTGRFPPLGLARGKGIRGQSGTCSPLTVAFPVPSVLL